jgi:uncharacterized protein (DUF2147 family)
LKYFSRTGRIVTAQQTRDKLSSNLVRELTEYSLSAWLKINFMQSVLNLTPFPIFLVAFVAITGLNGISPSHNVVGIWESEEKNLQIEMFEDNGRFAGRMIYFKCSSDEIMRISTDTENPDKNLISRKLLGLKLVSKLDYKGNNVWDDGKIYDPNSGRVFEARIRLTGPNTAVVRGYWKYRWIGRSIVFYRRN